MDGATLILAFISINLMLIIPTAFFSIYDHHSNRRFMTLSDILEYPVQLHVKMADDINATIELCPLAVIMIIWLITK